MAKAKVRELRFPLQGVVRGRGHEETAAFQPPYPAPWACNVFPEDPLAGRLRGGSRPGLTQFADDLAGMTIAGMLSVPTSSGSGVAAKLAIVADEALQVYSGGSYSSPSGGLVTEGSVGIVTEGGVEILADTGGVPAACYLCARGRVVYAVTSAGITSLDLNTGVVDTLVASAGTVPTGVTIGCFYRDRLFLAGGDNGVYASRQGDPTDWAFGAAAGDSGRAIPFQLGEASEVGAVCTALVPFKDSSLLASTQWGLWLILGDPATGNMRNIARGVGIIGPKAWCMVQDGMVGDVPVKHAIIFLGPNGLYMVAPTGEGLQAISDDRLPEELRDIPDTATVSLVYDPERRGVFVFLTPATGSDIHWFFDLVRQGFWPLLLPEVHQPLATCWHEGDVLLAGQDGYLRSVGGDDDDGVDIESHLLIGPLRLGSANVRGLLTSLHGIIGANSGTVAWYVITGKTAEEVCANGKAAIEAYQAGDTVVAEAYAAAKGTWTAGRSITHYPRTSGMWMCMWLRSAAKWGYEDITVESSDAGRWR